MPNDKHNNLSQETSDYFKLIATQSNHIDYDGNNGNYRQMGIEEIAAEGSNLNFDGKFGMIYEPIDIMISGRSLNDSRATPGIALWFIKYAPKDDFAARQAVEHEAFRIASSFLARIKDDQEKYPKGEDSNALFKNLDLSTASFKRSGMVGDYHYGWILEFEVYNDGQFEYIPEDWTI